MAKKQTRRSISVSKPTHARAYAHCQAENLSVSGYVESLIKADLDKRGVAEPDGGAPRRQMTRKIDTRGTGVMEL